ncbi:MAG: hypothetical protein AAF429_11045 [Pseudomonadota bacterium]
MRMISIGALATLATSSVAEDMLSLTGDALVTTLTNAQVYYDNAHRQFFYEDGLTEYSSGSQPSLGNWRIQNDQYCSQWPPQKDWDCYEVRRSADGSRIVFIGDHSDEYPGTLKK